MAFHDSQDAGLRDTPVGERVPMFPLPNIFLFPGSVLPLHVFETRYREMVADLLDRRGRLVLAAVQRDHHDDLSGDPPVFPVGGLGEIVQHQAIPDGRFMILVLGRQRVRLHEVEREHLYREVIAEPLMSVAASATVDEALRPELMEALRQRSRLAEQLEEEPLPLGTLADLLLQCLGLPQELMEPLYEELDVGARSEAALRLHGTRPLPPSSGASSRE